MKWFVVIVLTVTALALNLVRVEAGKFNKKLSVGDAAPEWSGLPGVDGKTHALADLKDRDVIVVVVTCNHCPVAVGYEKRIIGFTKKYVAEPGSKVAVVAISVSKEEPDRLEKMKERAAKAGFNFPYLHDDTQEIGRKFGATVTPEFFVLNKERKVVYMGAMDDDIRSAVAKTNYLEAAVEAALKGEKVARSETPAQGCSVVYQKKAK